MLTMNFKKTFHCLSLLDDLEYFALDSKSEEILHRSIKEALSQVGKAYAKATIDNICKLNRLSENEVLTNCDLFEDSLYKLYGRGALVIINKVKVSAMRHAIMEHKLNFTIPEILDPSLTISGVLKEIRRVEALDFIQKMSSYNHIAYLYSTKDSLNQVLAEFFTPGNSPCALLSENPHAYANLNLPAVTSYT